MGSLLMWPLCDIHSIKIYKLFKHLCQNLSFQWQIFDHRIPFSNSKMLDSWYKPEFKNANFFLPNVTAGEGF